MAQQFHAFASNQEAHRLAVDNLQYQKNSNKTIWQLNQEDVSRVKQLEIQLIN